LVFFRYVCVGGGEMGKVGDPYNNNNAISTTNISVLYNVLAIKPAAHKILYCYLCPDPAAQSVLARRSR
jgi:hypothetical protein